MRVWRAATIGAMAFVMASAVTSRLSFAQDEAAEWTARLSALVAGLAEEAPALKLKSATVTATLAGLTIDPEVIALSRRQPELGMAPWEYLARLVSDIRIEAGRQRLDSDGAVMRRIETAYGVDRHILMAIWGIETNFGATRGERAVLRSLATLAAVDERRPAFWRAELVAALRILERGDIAAAEMTGSWAGAMGHTQFMPTTYLAHAVDLDGDGRRDIWSTPADALASAAAYLKAHGWKQGVPWGLEARLSATVDLAAAGPDVRRTLAEWKSAGVEPAAALTPEAERRLAGEPLRLVLPAGARGAAFLVTGNFRAILRYNNATLYALAVGHLADRIAGGPAIRGSWPLDDRPLASEERIELQQRLEKLGYPVGSIDGVIGNRTRDAVRQFALTRGLPVDGYAGQKLLEAVRAASPP